MVAKMRSWLTTYRTYKFLTLLHFYKKKLSKTAHLAYTMQKQNALTDIRDSLQECLKKLDEFAQEDIDSPFESAQDEDGKLMILPKATNLPATQQFKQTNQLSEKQKKRTEKCLTMQCEKFKISNEYQGNKLSIKLKKPSCFL